MANVQQLNMTISDDSDLVSVQQQLTQTMADVQQLNMTISDDSDLVSVQQQLTQTMANVQQLNMTISDDSDLVSVQQQLTQTMANVQQLNMTISDDSDLVSVQQQLTQTMADVQQLNMMISDNSDLVLVQQQLTQTMTDVRNLDSRVTEDRNRISEEITNGQQVTYIRWGSNSCPSTSGTTLVYGGLMGANSFQNQGGGSNHLCMPTDPEYTLTFEQGTQSNSVIYGVEYQSEFFGSLDLNAPCAVCSVSTRAEMIMIPAKTSCPADWTREYVGYIMSERTGNYRTEYICVDQDMESVSGTSGHAESSDLWNTEASCTSLPCPPYNDQRELGCVVCTK